MHTTTWRPRGNSPRGIITGCDAGQEVFLPWWWWQTRCHTDLPVLFIDFGMSETGRRFCEERGEVVALPPADFVVGKEAVAVDRAELWERVFTFEFWQMRRPWFLKPFALLASPFEQTLWLDLDCALCESLKPLFDAFQGEICLAPEEGTYYSDHGVLPVGATSYNDGVILFQHGSPLISRWAERGMRENDRILTEQILLNMMAYEGANIQPLPKRYNWNMRHQGCNAVAIAHYVGDGKDKICSQIHLLEALGQIQRLK